MRRSEVMVLRRIACLAAFVALVLLFASRASAQPAYAAEYAGRSFPEASEKITLTIGETREGYFELTNVGTATWSTTTTKLATIPRDAESPLHDPSWENEARCTTVDAETPPGEVGRFSFTIRGNEPGDYIYAFGLVEEGVTWFADDGGPPDDSIFMRVRVIAPPPPTATAATVGVSTSAASGSNTSGAGGGGGASAEADGDAGSGCNVGSARPRDGCAAAGWLALCALLRYRRRLTRAAVRSLSLSRSMTVLCAGSCKRRR